MFEFSFKMGLNEIADLTHQEVAAVCTGLKAFKFVERFVSLGDAHEYSGKCLAASVDETTQGVVAPVKRQRTVRQVNLMVRGR